MVYRLEILTTAGADGERWHQLIEGLPEDQRDIHYTPAYGRIYELTYGKKARLAVYGDAENYVILPFFIEDVCALPFMAGWQSGPVFDISSPYGYGGPLVRSAERTAQRELCAAFFTEFTAYCRNNGIVSEYVRLHPLLRNDTLVSAVGGINLQAVKPVVYLDLRQDEEVLWQGVCRGHRSSIAKARRAGVTVVRETVDGAALATFRRLYDETMERAGAKSEWRFPDVFFSNCRECLGDDRISLFEARLGDVTVASYLVIHAYGTAYYHFGGSSAAHFDIRANNLLMFEIALWARRNGYRSLHLGGGYRKGDSVYRFKSGFSREEALVYSYSVVHDAERYSDLCVRCKQWAMDRGIELPGTDYFPTYRR